VFATGRLCVFGDTPEFKAQTVELVRTSHKSVSDICRDLDLTETAVVKSPKVV
jgi:hypothetical protein